MSVGSSTGCPARIASITSSTARPPPCLHDSFLPGQVVRDADARRTPARSSACGDDARTLPRAPRARASPVEHLVARPRQPLGLALVDERASRLPLAHLRLERLDLVRLDVGRVGDDQVERPRRRRRAGRPREARPPGRCASAFSRASSSAAAEMSVAWTRAPGCSCAIASAIAPLPVPTSTTRGASTPRSARGSARRRSPSRVAARAPVRRSCSVSRRKSQSPSTYASGSRWPRRCTSSRAAVALGLGQRPVVLRCRARSARGRAPGRAGAPRRDAGSRRRVSPGSRSRPRAPRRASPFERAPLLVGGQRVGEVVEIPCRTWSRRCVSA